MKLRCSINVLVILVLILFLPACGRGKSVVKGHSFKAWFNWDTPTYLKILETPAPYEPSGPGESTAEVDAMTWGELALSYTDTSGVLIEMERVIEIDNITRVISHAGTTVTTLQEIFEPLPSPSGKKTINLSMVFDNWVTIYISEEPWEEYRKKHPDINNPKKR